MIFFDAVKSDLGISHDKKDTEILACVNAAVTRMRTAGVQNIDAFDDYTGIAVKTYARSWFNYQGEGERYGKLFEEQLVVMSMSPKYNREALDGTEN